MFAFKKKGLEKASVSGYSVPLHCELRVALRSSHRPRVAPRAELRVAIKKARQEQPLSEAEGCPPVTAIILDMPCDGATMYDGAEALNASLHEMKRQTFAMVGERQAFIHEVNQLRGQVGEGQAAPTVGPSGATPTIDTKAIGKPDHFSGEATRFGDWSFKLQSHMGALDHRYERVIAEAEQSVNAILNAACAHGDAALSAQLLSPVSHVADGHGTGQVPTEDSRRGGSSQSSEEPKLINRYVGLLLFHSRSMVACLQNSLRLCVWCETTRSNLGNLWTMASRWE